ncbi:hypothetical protein [Devosia chinhatensis]|uniref:Uncharacterized protein n=1 Tax=Devosia chinhatensis TaxID=429727 RepID=A0A0F5FLY4_9HYPH|nr:hypothetical protein [Devosia chinhatensis]KKB09914.1 hypothetical protein VE26_08840 [Devosia chinhatensis]
MVTNLVVEPVLPGTTHLHDFRHRPAMGERTMLPDSAARPQPSPQPRNEQRQGDRRQENARTEPPQRSSSSMFAAAIIAGALPPVPKSMEELIRRIGMSEIPQESEARLKDILA